MYFCPIITNFLFCSYNAQLYYSVKLIIQIDSRMDCEAHRALSKMKVLFGGDVKQEDVAEIYDKWAGEYDGDIRAIGYQAPFKAAELLLKNIGNSSTKNLTVIDIACGTGCVGQALRELGFTGVAHGIDGSEQMIGVAHEKGVYEELLVQFLLPGNAIKTPQCSKYDALICVGAFVKDHLHPKVILEMVQLVRYGGILVFSARDSEDNATELKQLRHEIASLKESGCLEEMCTLDILHGVNWNADNLNSSQDKESFTAVHIFCMRKL